ncbi:MAG TPA: SRPBCC family protein [Longimicrobiales bacterium]
MTIVDELRMRAPAHLCLRIAADVERWPEILPHYRRVRFLQRTGFGCGRVEMAAWRHFGGPLRYPVWWVSEMRTDPEAHAIYYRHVDGVTRGMDVQWMFLPEPDGITRVRITHAWAGPDWPIIGRLAWERIIAPGFVSAIAQRTLAGVAAEALRSARAHDAARNTRSDTVTESHHVP